MKKNQTLLIIAAIVIYLSACKKSDTKQPDSSIIGNWNQIKLHISHTINGVTKDTTFNSSILPQDSFNFNSDSTAIFFDGPGNPPPGSMSPTYLEIMKYRYHISGSTLTLIRTSPPLPHLDISSFKTGTIIQLDSKNLILHDTYTSGADKISTDYYFVRE
jgi:hypothetical protein